MSTRWRALVAGSVLALGATTLLWRAKAPAAPPQADDGGHGGVSLALAGDLVVSRTVLDDARDQAVSSVLGPLKGASVVLGNLWQCQPDRYVLGESHNAVRSRCRHIHSWWMGRNRSLV